MKKLITILFLFAVIGNLLADISVKSFRRLENDMDARVTEPLMDQNGDLCAIIKVVTTQTGFTSFDCGLTGVMKTVQKNSEIWVYVPYGAKRITITHPILGVLRDYFFPEPITKATVYELVLTTAKVITTIDESIDSHYLLIHAEPNKAMIYLNDQFVTIGEYQSKLIPGSYTYRVEMPMYHTEAGKIEITDSKQVLNVKLKPAFGTAHITTSPDSSATVLIDGKVQSQTTPCESEALASGEHTVQVVKEMYQPAAQKIMITDGQTTALNIVLQPNFAEVSITAPTDATLFINNQQKGVGKWQGRLNTGIYTIEARLDKHYPIQQDIEVKAGDKRTIDLQPTPIYGTLDITTKPAGASITINGTTYGNTPNIVKNLLIGDYIVLLTKTGYTSITKTVTITDGKSTDLIETLVIGNDQTAETYYKSGKAKYKLKDYKGAVIDYTKAIEINSKYLEAYKGRGDSKYYLEDYNGAIEDYTKAIEIDPKFIKAYFNRGLAKNEIKDYAGTIIDFDKGIELNPKDTLAYKTRGDAKAALADFNGAIEDFTKAMELNPKYAEAYYGRGNVKSQLNDYQGAIIDYSKVIEIDFKNTDAYIWRGNAKVALKDNEGAVKDFNKAIEIDPKNAGAYYCRGDAKYNLQNYQGAIIDYSKVIEIDPKRADAYIWRGNAKDNLKDSIGAIKDFNKAIEIDPQNAEAYFFRGTAKKLKESIEEYTKAIELNPNYLEAYKSRGYAKFAFVDYTGAIVDYSKIIEIDSMNQDAYHWRGYAKQYTQDYDGAIADFTKITENAPEPAVKSLYFAGIGDIKLDDLKDYKGAIIAYTKAIDNNPLYVELYEKRGRAKYHTEDFSGSIVDFTKAIEIDSKNADAYSWRGNSKMQLNDYQGAISDYTMAIQIEPNDGSFYRSRGLSKSFLNDYQGAISDYNLAIQIDPKDGLFYYFRGDARIALGQKTAACLDYSKAGELGYADAYEAIKKNCQ